MAMIAPKIPPLTYDSQQSKPEPYFMRLPQVLKRLGIGKSSFYNGIKLKIYPSPSKLGCASVWLSTTIDQVIENALNSK